MVPPRELALGVVDVPHEAAAVAAACGVLGVAGVRAPPHDGRAELGERGCVDRRRCAAAST